MEALSKVLENAVENGKIKLHPNCKDPRVTHLHFVDNLLVFSDGSRHSLKGISDVMAEFITVSGLELNPRKSEIFFGGYLDIEASVLSDLSGFKLGTFHTRYLGLPLKPGKRLSLAVLQPLIDKIGTKLQSWTVKYLSFTGKITLIYLVIYGLVNFWSAVFVLPKDFYAKIDSICDGFLWNNDASSARESRVAWADICKPKAEGGFGIRRLEDFEKFFRLKRVWNFFTTSGSIWVVWLKRHTFRRLGFWLTLNSNKLFTTIK
ncbi:PREDICTED: uncharacterized protein LOC106323501 [Brassica oleracea var. oleracea]|uniref:uncharacterized protein LOC106323501 n=1 Tax=Brassica oleracea var. oleracea TaxID=109376 RepID=UPI0006A70266|nr:PREDICTED: uncharacterized protein LOC106323501 [Brassica oleracea var. oleracea]